MTESSSSPSGAVTSPASLLDALVPGRYVVDESASQVRFAARHLFNLGSVHGGFGRVEGHVDVGTPVQSTSGRLSIDAASFDSRHARRDGQVRGRRFLHVEQHPAIVVDWSSVEITADGVRASVTVHAHGEPAQVDAQLGDLSIEGHTVRATMTGRVDRYAHGVTAAKGMAGRYLDVTIDLVTHRQN